MTVGHTYYTPSKKTFSLSREGEHQLQRRRFPEKKKSIDVFRTYIHNLNNPSTGSSFTSGLRPTSPAPDVQEAQGDKMDKPIAQNSHGDPPKPSRDRLGDSLRGYINKVNSLDDSSLKFECSSSNNAGYANSAFLQEERHFIHALRHQTTHRIRQEQHAHLFSAFVRAHEVIKEIEKDLRQIGGCKMTGFKNNEGEKTAITSDYSVEARVFQLVGRTQRALRGLTTIHYTAAATLPLNDGRVSSLFSREQNSRERVRLLLSFVKTATDILHHIRALPRRTSYFISPAQAETYFRTSGVCHASSEAIKALFATGDSLLSMENAVLRLFHLALFLPVEMSPILTIQTREIPESDGGALLPAQMRTEEWCVRVLLSHPSPSPLYHHNVKKPNPMGNRKEWARGKAPNAKGLFPSQRISVVRACMMATNTSSPSSGAWAGGMGGDRGALRVPYGLGKAYAEALIRDFARNQGPPDASTAVGDEVPQKDLPWELHVQDMATLCAAIIYFEVHTREAVKLLVRGAPFCMQEVDLLNGREISSLMLAYAMLRYDGNVQGSSEAPMADASNPSQDETLNKKHKEGKNFYLELGTRAGRIADSLSEADVERILRALELIGIPHKDLRASLESSLRMRSLNRKVCFNIG
ncbi:unnamed protein product [Phytomonas sp. Hart1]|nr:unnamed protein product [Phytomonas sp. Hart1]|eukprot:CCW70417.1 unnamed protein product [Phytomonas sp. isolate Hart1]